MILFKNNKKFLILLLCLIPIVSAIYCENDNDCPLNSYCRGTDEKNSTCICDDEYKQKNKHRVPLY